MKELSKLPEDRTDGLVSVLESRGSVTPAEAEVLRSCAAMLRKARARILRLEEDTNILGESVGSMAARIAALKDRLSRYEDASDSDRPVGPNARATA